MHKKHFIILTLLFFFSITTLVRSDDEFCSGLNNFQTKYKGTSWELSTTTCNTTSVFLADSPTEIASQWKSYTQSIAKEIGEIPTNQLETTSWKNSANSISDLYELSQETIPIFRSFVNQTINFDHNSTVFATFGPGDLFITKSFDSLENKASRLIAIGNLQPWKTIDDSIRGTIVVGEVNSFRKVIENLQETAQKKGHKITFDNKFTQVKPSGYVGVHTAILIKSIDDRYILGELQVHFEQIMDGTLQCPKEYTHPIYESVRSLILSDSNDSDKRELEDNGNLAQKFVYLYGMTNIPNITPIMLKSTDQSSSSSSSSSFYSSEVVTNFLFSDGVLFKQVVDNYAENIFVYLPDRCSYSMISPADLENEIDSFAILLSTSRDEEIIQLENSLCSLTSSEFSTGLDQSDSDTSNSVSLLQKRFFIHFVITVCLAVLI